MSGPAPGIEPTRYVLEPLLDGGILLDLTSGLIFELNRTASFIWERQLAGTTAAQISEELGARYGVSEEDGRRDVARTLALADVAPAATPALFHYRVEGDHYVLADSQSTLLEIAPERQIVRALGSIDASKLDLCLSALAPKLASLLGLSVMHASAVMDRRGAATLFTGKSGAGKTTTARALVKASSDWTIVAEDKVVLRRERGVVAAALDGERRIVTWMEEARERLVAKAGAECQTTSLREAGAGRGIPIERVLLIDSARRRPGPLMLESRGQTAAAREIFQAGFYGSAAAEDWTRQVQVAAALARSAPTFEATMPGGLEALNEMAARYAATTTS